MIPSSTTITEGGRRLRRSLIWIGAILVGVNLVAWILGSLFDAEGASAGPDGSSYVTTPRGSAAFAGLLDRLDRDVVRSRVPFDDGSLSSAAALVMIDVDAGSYTAGEMNAVDRFAQAGGTVLIGGRSETMARLLDDAPAWRPRGADEAVSRLARARDVTVSLSGFGSLVAGSADEVVLEGADLPIGIRRPLGSGEILWVADAGPFYNETIGTGETAVAVIALLPESGTIIFDELRHGYGVESGLWPSLPSSVRTALMLGAVVGAATLVAYGRRFGPAHELERRMPPGREQYLDAVGGMLDRSDARPEALAAIRREALETLENRSGAASVERAAASAGLSDEQITALLGDGDDDGTLLLADGALAALKANKRGDE